MILAQDDLQNKRLFHYTCWNEERFRQVVCESRIYFSCPLDFNDPFECRPVFNHTIADDENRRKQIASYLQGTFLRKAAEKGVEIDHKVEAERFARLVDDPELLAGMIEQLTQGMQDVVRSKHRVLCLTPHPDSLLMWALYADKHRGLCCEFDAAVEPFGFAAKVVYREQQNLLEIDSEDDQILLEEATLAKSSAWEREHEYRVVATNEQTEYLQLDNNFLHFPAPRLTSIVLGARVTPDTEARIREIVRESGREIRILQANIHPTQYLLSLE